MSFFQTVTPAQPAPAPGPGLPPRPMPLAQAGRGQAVTILLPDGVPRFAGHTLSELFQAANQLISTAAHEVELRALSDCPGGDPAYWRGRQAVFLGDIQTPWRCARRQWQRAQQIITLAQGSVLVGGAVFLVEGSTHAAQQPLAIHANFALAAAEAGLMAPARPALFLDRGRVHSAVSPLAAVMLMLAPYRPSAWGLCCLGAGGLCRPGRQPRTGAQPDCVGHPPPVRWGPGGGPLPGLDGAAP